MCGIILHFGDQEKSRDIIKQGLIAMKHRGESQTIHYGEGFSIGHRRLAITDITSNGHPYKIGMYKLWNVGEYYDVMVGEPDTLALLKVIRSGRYPQGMYSGVTHIDGSSIVNIHTDQLGKKPLYYRVDTKTIASEIKALTTEILPDVEINNSYFKQLVYMGLPENGSTPYKNIVKLGQGVFSINLETKAIHLKRRMPSSCNNFMLEEAVMKRIPTEVPFAFLLSGGLDSSLIHRIVTERCIHPKTIHYAQQDDTFGTEIVKKICPKAIIMEEPIEPPDLKEVLYANESPLDLGSLIPQFNLFKTARKNLPNAKVIVTGDGADELFWGYKRAQDHNTRDYDLQELHTWHIPRLDKIGMWFGFEIRCPYLDDNVYDYSKTLEHQFHKGKKPLKALANKIGLHPSIINRPKHPLKSNVYKAGSNHKQHLVDLFLKYFPKGLRL